MKKKDRNMKKQNNIVILIIFFLSLSHHIYAQENRIEYLRINMEQAIDMALKASESYLIKENEIEKTDAQYKSTKSAIYPQIKANIEWYRNTQYPAKSVLMNNYSLDSGVSVDQLIWAFGRVSSAVSAADKFLNISRLNKEITEQEIIYNAKLSYFNVLLSVKIYQILKESYENADENKRILEEKFASGRPSKRDNIKMKADVAARIPLMNDAKSKASSAQKTFKTLIGLSVGSSVDLIDKFKEEYEKLEDDVLKFSLYEREPSLKMLDKDVAMREDFVKVKKAGYYPEIYAFAKWNHKGIGEEYDIGSNNLENYGLAGLKVSVPIWAGGKTGQDLRIAKIDRENASLKLKETKEQLTLELDNAISEYHEYIETLKANNDAVNLVKESFEMSRDLFTSGQVSQADLNDAELLLTNVRLSKEMTLFNINITLAKIEKLTLPDKAR